MLDMPPYYSVLSNMRRSGQTIKDDKWICRAYEEENENVLSSIGGTDSSPK